MGAALSTEPPLPHQQDPPEGDDPLTEFALYARSKMGPFGRYPYASAFVAMALLMTLTRNCTRHIPDPPPVLGALPAWQGEGSGAPSSERLLGRAYLLQIIPPDCPPAARCQGPDPVSERIAQGLFHTRVPVPVVVLSAAGEPAAAAPDGADLRRAVVRPEMVAAVAAAAAHHARAPEGSADGDFVRLSGRILLVDQAGQLRGIYPLTGDLAGDEAYHRARHVYGERYEGPFGAGCGGFER